MSGPSRTNDCKGRARRPVIFPAADNSSSLNVVDALFLLHEARYSSPHVRPLGVSFLDVACMSASNAALAFPGKLGSA